MQRALVVIDDTDQHRNLLREAGELASGVDSDLVLVATMTEQEYEEDIETIEAIRRIEEIEYGDDAVLETAEKFASSIAREELGDIDVEYRTVGAVVDEGERAHTIIETAEDTDCDYVFMPGRRRSPTGKAIFGDTAQSVILNFDGKVTISTSK